MSSKKCWLAVNSGIALGYFHERTAADALSFAQGIRMIYFRKEKVRVDVEVLRCKYLDDSILWEFDESQYANAPVRYVPCFSGTKDSDRFWKSAIGSSLLKALKREGLYVKDPDGREWFYPTTKAERGE